MMASGISDEQRRKDLTQEYLFIQGQYEDYDKRSLTIKGWVSSGAVAALALAFNSSYGNAVVVPVIVAVVVAIVWWFRSYARDEPIYPYEKELPGIRRRPRTRFVRLMQAMFLRFVCLPYLPVIIICAASAFILGRAPG